MRLLTPALLTIFLFLAGGISLQTFLASKSHGESRDEYLTVIEYKRQQIVLRHCKAMWPQRTKRYDACLDDIDALTY